MACGQALDEPATGPAVPERTETSAVPVLPAVEPADDDVDLVTCPTCGASNAVRRRRCGRCGQSLVTPSEPRPVPEAEEEIAPVPVDTPTHTSGWNDDATDPPGGPSRRRRRRGLGVVVVVLGLVVGTGLGVAAGTGTGPFATLEPVAFDPTAYPRDPAVQQPATTGASSTATGAGDRAFGPEHTVDGDLTTAWQAEGEAEGARLRHGFVAPVWITRIEVATGDQSTPDAFAAAGRATEVLIDLGSQRLDVQLADQPGVQLVTLPEPVLTDQVTWEVTSVAGGAPAIAEVRYVGWPADEADREAYRERG